MAIKLRRPDPTEERLSWMKNVAVEICVDEGRIKGKLDFQFLIMPPSELDAELSEADQQKTYDFVTKILRSVRGMKDEDGEDWSETDQLDFVLLAPELTMVAFRSYFAHTTSGDYRKKD